MEAQFDAAPDVEPSDAAFMLRYYAGDQGAGGEIDRQFRHWLERQAYWHLPKCLPSRRELAEDLASNTLMKVVLTAGRLEARWNPTKGTVVVWLGGILRNEVKSFLRRKKGKESLDADRFPGTSGDWERDWADSIEDPQPGPCQAVEALEERNLVTQGVKELTPELHDIVMLKYVEECTHTEIGKRYGLSDPTISRRLAEARQRLKRALRGLFEESSRRLTTRSLSL